MALCLFSASQLEAQWEVGEITIEGNRSLSEKSLRERMTLEEGESYSEWKADEDRAAIIAMYNTRGFLDAEIVKFDIETDIETQKVNVLIEIREGNQTILRKIEVTGNTVFSSRDLLEQVEIRTGRPLNARRLARLKQSIVNRYTGGGYLYVEVNERSYFPTGEGNAEIYFDIVEGPQVRVGKIEIEGNEKTRTYVIRRGVTLEPGDIYTDRKMSETKTNLYRLGIFDDVRHELIGLEEEKEVIDIVLTVSEGDYRVIGAGGGVGDVDGLRGWVEWGHHNLFDRAFGLLQLTRMTYQPFEENAVYKYSFSSSMTLRQPFFFNSKLEASTTGLFEKIGYAHHDEEIFALNLLVRNMLAERREISLLTELNRRNIFSVDTASADQSIIDNSGENITHLISPLLMFDYRNDRFNPRRGFLMVLRSTLAGGPFLFGSINFYRASIEGTYLQPIWSLGSDEPMVLAGKLKLGIVREFGSTPSVPPSEAFNIGGGKSLRGYNELSIGPLNDRNVPGNVVVQLNTELRFPIWNAVGGVVFLDAANVFEELHFDERFRLLATSGTGLRYETPVGPMRVDFALKLNHISRDRLDAAGGVLEQENDSWGAVHFGIGHAF